MAVLELAAKHQIDLSPGNQIAKGETYTMHIGNIGAAINILGNPESRRLALKQFQSNGVDLSNSPNLLNYNHWEVRNISPKQFLMQANELGHSTPIESLKVNEVPQSESQLKEKCTDIVKTFYNEGLNEKFWDSGLEGRCEIAQSFYSEIKETMHISATMEFVPQNENSLGSYNPENNTISLNAKKYLYGDMPNVDDMINTIVHESRHAYQHEIVDNPERKTDISKDTIREWKDNFDNYISPYHDFEAYRNQPVEADAFDFADNVCADGRFHSQSQKNFV